MDVERRQQANIGDREAKAAAESSLATGVDARLLGVEATRTTIELESTGARSRTVVLVRY
ncbi:MAG: hypothetical protein F6K32_17115 [Desertifilum sp. SIO1I2]|nr:hypothetical protein [Desertifilum sp. SIO1I2]